MTATALSAAPLKIFVNNKSYVFLNVTVAHRNFFRQFEDHQEVRLGLKVVMLTWWGKYCQVRGGQDFCNYSSMYPSSVNNTIWFFMHWNGAWKFGGKYLLWKNGNDERRDLREEYENIRFKTLFASRLQWTELFPNEKPSQRPLSFEIIISLMPN